MGEAMDGYGGYDYGYDENVPPAENNAFVMRMAQDIAKRENEKRVNEMRKTVEGRRVLKQMGMMPAAKKTDKGMKVKPGKMIPEPQTCERIGAGAHSEPDTGIIRSGEGRGAKAGQIPPDQAAHEEGMEFGGLVSKHMDLLIMGVVH